MLQSGVGRWGGGVDQRGGVPLLPLSQQTEQGQPEEYSGFKEQGRDDVHGSGQ